MNRLSHIKAAQPMWNEMPAEHEPWMRTAEEQVEARRKFKRLPDCELPEGFRLVSPRPKQYWMGNQLVWGFCLAWARVKNGVRGADEYLHVARYYPTVSDEPQMRWAIEDFTAELAEQERRERAPMVQHRMVSTLVHMRIAS